jgi:hypothetical protein
MVYSFLFQPSHHHHLRPHPMTNTSHATAHFAVDKRSPAMPCTSTPFFFFFGPIQDSIHLAAIWHCLFTSPLDHRIRKATRILLGDLLFCSSILIGCFVPVFPLQFHSPGSSSSISGSLNRLTAIRFWRERKLSLSLFFGRRNQYEKIRRGHFALVLIFK